MGRFFMQKENTLPTQLDDMRAVLELLEAEMRAVNWWQDVPPSVQQLSSTQPFCVDTLRFSEWLQWVYTPKMHAFMNQTGRLPKQSGLHPIAQEAWKQTPENTVRLLAVVKLLDAIVQDAPYQQAMHRLLLRKSH